MSRFVAILLGAVFVQSSAFVAPGASRPALRSRYGQMQRQAEIPQETSNSPFAAVLMASFVGVMLGLTSGPKVARAEESAAPVVVDKKAKLKAEIEKAQAAIKKNAKSKEERLKEQIAQLKEVEKTAETDFATKWDAVFFLHPSWARAYLPCAPQGRDICYFRRASLNQRRETWIFANWAIHWAVPARWLAKCQKVPWPLSELPPS